MNRSTESGYQNLQFQDSHTIFWNSKKGMIYCKPFFSLDPRGQHIIVIVRLTDNVSLQGMQKLDHLPKVGIILKLLGKRHICLADTKSGKQPAAPESAVSQPGLCSSTQLPTAALCDALVPKPACSKPRTKSTKIRTSFILLNSDYFKWQLL